jgi:hypothetical protein
MGRGVRLTQLHISNSSDFSIREMCNCVSLTPLSPNRPQSLIFSAITLSVGLISADNLIGG